MGSRGITKSGWKHTDNLKYWCLRWKLDFNQYTNAVFSCGNGHKHQLTLDGAPRANRRTSSSQGRPGKGVGLLSLLVREWVKWHFKGSAWQKRFIIERFYLGMGDNVLKATWMEALQLISTLYILHHLQRPFSWGRILHSRKEGRGPGISCGDQHHHVII